MKNNYKKELIEICNTITQECNKYNIANHALTKQYKQEFFDATRAFPSSITTSKRIRAIAQDNLCICLNCNEVHGDIDGAGFCNKKCYHEYKAKNVITEETKKDKAIEKSQQKYKNAILDYDYIICKICGFYGAELTSHVQSHNTTPDEYKKRFNVESVKCKKLIEQVSGSNNPGYQHNGRFSAFSDKFIYANTAYSAEVKQKAAKNRKDNNGNTTNIEYWLKKTHNNIEMAQTLLSSRQSTFSLEKCIEKYGEEKGLEVWSNRQEKWLKTLNSKPQKEIDSINKKKSNIMSYSNLWTNKSICTGKFYLLDLGNNYYKIGITSNTIEKRYNKIKKDNYTVLLDLDSSITHCFQIEQLIKQIYFKQNTITKQEKVEGFGWTETLKIFNINSLLETINTLYNNKESTVNAFKENFNLRYDENF